MEVGEKCQLSKLFTQLTQLQVEPSINHTSFYHHNHHHHHGHTLGILWTLIKILFSCDIGQLLDVKAGSSLCAGLDVSSTKIRKTRLAATYLRLISFPDQLSH